ncbi:MAG: prephenate dehydratase [Saprospiraceae bacterium]|nr:prephenate dehydratase [Saprospiraceae bacterium]
MSDSSVSLSTTPAQKQLTPPAVQGQRITIQGVRGAFHEIAARQFFGEVIQVVPALSFPILFEKTADPQQADAAILAIENSIAGSILGNYKLLENSDLVVVGEVYLRIQQNLLALPGTPIDQLREVHSHPMALAQCSEFFKKHPRIRLVESEDTAESAARIVRHRAKHIGAIASTLAAEIYGLTVLEPAIETVPENFTRFLAIQRKKDTTPILYANKASVCFNTGHQPGSLAEILTLLARLGANLTKIQSMPLLGRPWEYRFFADFTAFPDSIDAVIETLKEKTMDLQVLGVYLEGNREW